MAKLHATEQAQKVIDLAVQLHGGMGVTNGAMVESLYREIRALRIYEGASEVQRQIIARDLLKETRTMNILQPPGWPRPEGLCQRRQCAGDRPHDLHRRRDRLGRAGDDRLAPARPAVRPGAQEHRRDPRRGRRRARAYRPDDGLRHRPRRNISSSATSWRRSGSRSWATHYPAMALVEVKAVWSNSSALVEIEATAVVPE